MESTGIRNKIQISESTAQLLEEAGKEHWIVPREETVNAKGKGTMATFWLVNKNTQKRPSVESMSSMHQKRSRTIDWAVELLSKRIDCLTSQRGRKVDDSRKFVSSVETEQDQICCLDEVRSVIKLRRYSNRPTRSTNDSIDLNIAAKAELFSLVEAIAGAYHAGNPYHNFEHACHVTMVRRFVNIFRVSSPFRLNSVSIR